MTATHAQIVSALYLAYCGRPAEPGGLAYWTQRLDEAGGNIDAIIDGFAYSAESATRFANLSTEQSIGLLYQELLNRTPEPVGTAYWQSAVNNEFLGVYLPSRIFYAAQGRDATTAQVRQSVADQFTALLPTDGSGYQGPAALDAARLVLQSGNASTSAADISALASAGITLAASATTNPGLITALTGANGRLTDLLGTAAGKADPLALVKLVNTIVSTAADSGAPVSTLLGNKTLTEVITTLRPGVTLTELEAAIQEGGFDNGVVVINPPVNPPVNPPAPPPDDGPAPGLTLTVAVDPATGKITFGGSATGDITFSVGADGLATFVRGGVAAGQKVALTSIQSLPAGTTVKLPATGADVTLANAKLLKDATWFDLDANPYRIQDSTAHILAELGSSSGGVAAGSLLGNATAISATDGPMAMTAAQFATSGFAAKLADGVVTLDLGDSGATGPQLAVIAAHSSKVAANGITGTLQLATLDGTTLDATHNSALLSKAADSATVSVDAAAMTAAELSTISSSIAKVDTLTHLALTSAQSAAEITALLGKTTSAKANTTDMDAAQLAAVFANAANLADNSITAATLSGAQLQAMDTAGTLGKLAAASVTLSGALSDTETALVIAQISKIATGGISAITLTEAQASAALLGQAALKDGAVTLGAVTDTSKEAVLGALDKIAPDGITAITLTQAQATPTLLAHVALKNGSVTVGAVTDTSKEAVLGALNKMADNGITVITLTEAQATPTLLAHAALKNGSVTLGAVTDDSKAAVLAALDKMAADGITTITLTTQQATPEVLAHPAFKSGSVTLSGTVDQAYLNSLGAAASKLATGSVQTITFSDDAALQEAALLIASDTVGANSIELTDGAITSAKATVLANLGKFKVDQVTSIMLTDAEATTDLLSNDVLKNGSVTIGAVTTSKEAVLVALDKIAAGGIGAITLTKAQATVELLSSAVLANGSVTISDAVDDDFFVSLVINSNLAKIAVGGITAITLGKQQATVELLGNAVLANGSVTISDAVDAAFLDTLTTNNTLAKIALGGIAAITLTEAQASADLLGSSRPNPSPSVPSPTPARRPC